MDFQLVEHKESAWIIQIISFEIFLAASIPIL